MDRQALAIGIIGLGDVAKAHLQAYQLLDFVRITALCDRREPVVTALANAYQASAYTDYRLMLKEQRVDLVLVLTPAATHCEIVQAVAAAGQHVLCEKPLATTIADAEAMIAACQRAGVKLFYGECYRYLPAIQQAHKLIRAGAIGEIQLMTEELIGGSGLDRYQQLPAVHYPLGSPGGHGMGVIDHGVHTIDTFSWFCEADIVKVQGRGQIAGEPTISEFLAIEYANGAIGHLIYHAATFSTCLPNEGMFSEGQAWLADASMSEAGLWEDQPGSMSVYGSLGALRIFHYTNALFINTGDGLRQVPLDGRPAFGHFATQLEDCADAIAEDREPTIGGVDGLRALQAALGASTEPRLKGERS